MSGIGEFAHLVEVWHAGPTVKDPEGGFTETWIPLDPPIWYCAIAPVTLRDLERLSGGGITQTATHMIRGRYHPTLAGDCRITFRGRTFDVASVHDPDQRQIAIAVVAHEVTADLAGPTAAAAAPGAGG